jgi:hypothetical protein
VAGLDDDAAIIRREWHDAAVTDESIWPARELLWVLCRFAGPDVETPDDTVHGSRDVHAEQLADPSGMRRRALVEYARVPMVFGPPTANPTPAPAVARADGGRSVRRTGKGFARAGSR